MSITEPNWHFEKGLILAFCSNELSREGKDQMVGKKESSMWRREVLQRSTMSQDDPQYEDVVGQHNMEMNIPKGGSLRWSMIPTNCAKWSFTKQLLENYK